MHPVKLALCKTVMMDLLRSKGAEVLDQLTIPKFAKIFIMLIKLDNLTTNSQGEYIREWPEAI